MTFTEDWFSVQSERALANLALTTGRLSGKVVEVGCWEGRSTCALANAVAPDTLHAVDTWAGSPGEPSERLAGERDVLATFKANIQTLTAGNVEIHHESWQDFFSRDVGPIRLLHIDASHSYDEVRGNIEAALPFIVPGGIVCGDDAHYGPVTDAARDVLQHFYVVASLWVWRKGD